MGRMYVATGTAVATTTARLLFQIETDDDSVVLIHRIALRPGTIVDEASGVILSRYSAAATGGSPTISGNPLDPGDAADSATILNVPTGGTSGVELGRWNMSTLAGLEVIYTPEERPILSGANARVVVETEDTITSADVDWTIVYEEIG